MPTRQDVFLRSGSASDAVPAILVWDVALDQIRQAQAEWRTFLVDSLRTRPHPPEHAHWDWVYKAEYALARRHYQLVGIEASSQMQGLMILAFHRTSRLLETLGQPLVYVDYLATAPWNLSSLCDAPRFRSVGQVLLAGAILASRSRDGKGRIGLHALPQAELFYTRCGMTDLGIDPAYEGLRYYEMSASQADGFLTRR